MDNNIRKTLPSDKEYQKVKSEQQQVATRHSKLNYRRLANEITSSPAGTILEITSNRGMYTNIVKGLLLRKLTKSVHYSISFRKSDENDSDKALGKFFIEVLDAKG